MVRYVLKVSLCALMLSSVSVLGACGDDDAGASDDGDDDGTDPDAGSDDGEDDGECDHLEGCPPDAGADEVVQTGTWTDVTVMPGVPIDGSEATLTRTADGLEAEVTIPGYIEGNVYTFWWVIYQNPEICTGGTGEPNLCLAPDDLPSTGEVDHLVAVQAAFLYGVPAPEGGVIIDKSGTLTLSRSYPANADPAEAIYLPPRAGLDPLPADYFLGLTDPLKAEVHLAIRDHGPEGNNGIDVDEQRSDFTGANCGEDPLYPCSTTTVVAFAGGGEEK